MSVTRRLKFGDIVVWSDERFMVLEDSGEFGAVVELSPDGGIIDPFYWDHCGSTAKKIGNINDGRSVSDKV